VEVEYADGKSVAPPTVILVIAARQALSSVKPTLNDASTVTLLAAVNVGAAALVETLKVVEGGTNVVDVSLLVQFAALLTIVRIAAGVPVTVGKDVEFNAPLSRLPIATAVTVFVSALGSAESLAPVE
jgi:hypothetical protein